MKIRVSTIRFEIEPGAAVPEFGQSVRLTLQTDKHEIAETEYFVTGAQAERGSSSSMSGPEGLTVREGQGRIVVTAETRPVPLDGPVETHTPAKPVGAIGG